ncbi:hypothetical protein [Mucilaginibacter phyllosphaerae]|uniref:Uncharacterized protein n=1 Tax=Mucilaginibacter phyllosphaerae TaxID=1812349 RepID=A0A4Y8A8Q9_9SPHI|nr:hypothetical protein [Mucilaginibacter phyllosphaerae]MBB3970817.1 hypothetical protein [Mucilaginibacter phyllosphaerae]TEW64244.1 hypothetical protein E2R65_18015 [Mucilaginibacter phyllosphaerae]GGH04797.1 hypothetical protein GCM10007352_08200 [Mucilaginibacter phyllosphaerae]
MILEDFLYRLKLEYHTLHTLNTETYYQRLASLFVVLELDGDNLNAEHDLGLDQVLEKMNDINEDDLHQDLSPEELALLIKKVKTGLALLINQIEA